MSGEGEGEQARTASPMSARLASPAAVPSPYQGFAMLGVAAVLTAAFAAATTALVALVGASADHRGDVTWGWRCSSLLMPLRILSSLVV